MVLFILLSIFGIGFAMTLLITPYIAAPTYAGMIFIEFYISLSNRKVPEFFRFKQPHDDFYRCSMDLVASITTTIGGLYVYISNSYIINHEEGKFWELFFSNKILNPIFPSVFCFCLLILYFMNNRNKEDNRDPTTKLKELCKHPSVPFFLRK